jgi:predicted metal-binding membrane protein
MANLFWLFNLVITGLINKLAPWGDSFSALAAAAAVFKLGRAVISHGISVTAKFHSYS